MRHGVIFCKSCGGDKLFGRGRDELAGVGESGKEGMLEDVYFAAGGGGAVADRIEMSV